MADEPRVTGDASEAAGGTAAAAGSVLPGMPEGSVWANYDEGEEKRRRRLLWLLLAGLLLAGLGTGLGLSPGSGSGRASGKPPASPATRSESSSGSDASSTTSSPQDSTVTTTTLGSGAGAGGGAGSQTTTTTPPATTDTTSPPATGNTGSGTTVSDACSTNPPSFTLYEEEGGAYYWASPGGSAHFWATQDVAGRPASCDDGATLTVEEQTPSVHGPSPGNGYSFACSGPWDSGCDATAPTLRQGYEYSAWVQEADGTIYNMGDLKVTVGGGPQP